MKKNKKLVLSVLPVLGATAIVASTAAALSSCSTKEATNISDEYFEEYALNTANAGFSITSQSNYVTVESGAEATLVVNTDSSLQTNGDLMFTWYIDRGNGEGWKLVQGGSKNTFKVDTTYTRNTSSAKHYRFRVTVANRYDSSKFLTSEEINVTVKPVSTTYINVKSQPTVSQTVTSSQMVTLSTTATIKGDKTISYQWYKIASNGVITAVDGATSATYTFRATNSSSEAVTEKYFCRFADAANPSVFLDESHVAAVTINPSDIKVTSQSQLVQSIKSNSEITLFVNATDAKSRTLAYEWYASKDNGNTYTKVQAGTKNTYLIDKSQLMNVTDETTWTFYVKIYPWGEQTVENSINYYLTETYSVKVEPQSETVTIKSVAASKDSIAPNESVNLTVDAESSSGATLSYQWYELGTDNLSWNLIANATSPTYTVTPSSNTALSYISTKKYMVMVKSGNINVQSNEVTVTVKPTSLFTNAVEESSTISISTQSPIAQSLNTDSSLTLFANATDSASSADLIYEWYVNKDGTDNFTPIQAGTINRYTISSSDMKSVTTETTWRYYAKIHPRNNSNEFIQTQVFAVNLKPVTQSFEILKVSATKTTLSVGQKSTLSVSTTASSGLALTYQWYELAETTGTWTEIPNATESSYEVTAGSVSDATTKTYMVMVKGGSKSIQSDSITISIQPEEVAEESISVTTVGNQKSAAIDSKDNLLTPYNNAWFEVKVGGDQTGLTYQWYYSGRSDNNLVKIINATSSTYTPSVGDLKAFLDNNGGSVSLHCVISRNGKVITTVSDPGTLYLRVVLVK